MCDECPSRKHAPIHLYTYHNIIDQGSIFKWNNDNHLIWQHFTKKDVFNAECKHCGTLFKTAYNKRYLDRHLRAVHSQKIAAIQEEITRTWISPHFTFDLDNCNISCMHCSYSVKIYDGVDVLSNHLNNSHHINEDLGFHGKTENYNVIATTQQSITEGNTVTTVTTSSQDHTIGVNRSGIQDPQR